MLLTSKSHALMQHTTPPMEGSFALPLHNGSNVGAVKQMKDPSAASGKSVVVLKCSDVRIRHGKVFMPNTIEMAQLKKPEKGQFKTNVQFSSTMTEMDVRKLLEGIFPFLRNQRLYCAAAVDNRTRLHFHGQPRVWTGYFLRQTIKGNSALYVVTDEGEIEALQVAQNSSSSDTGFFDQGVDYISSSVVDDIHPKSGSLEGGYKCQINLTEPLESNVTSGTAQFKGVDDNVPWQKLNPFTLVLSVPPSTKAGNVDVEVFDQTGKRLGMTVFCYRDFQWEMVKQMISNKNLGSLFSILAQKFESSQLGGGDNAAQGIGPLNMQDQGQTQQQQSLQLLQLLVYTAAETDAQEFIKVIFSTSAGPIVFNSYKDKTPLPEDVARANGHRYLAQYLQDVNTRLSKEVGSEAQSNAIDWLELVKAVQTQASAAQGKSIKEQKHSSESDENSSDYFADSETSSHGSSGFDDANPLDLDSDSSIDKELCNIAGLYHEEPNKRPAICAWQEGPSCETCEVEKPPDSTRKKKDETKSATLRRFHGETFFCGPFDTECAEKDHMSSQRRTRCIVITCVLIAVLSGITLSVYDVILVSLVAGMVGVTWALSSSLSQLWSYKRKKSKDEMSDVSSMFSAAGMVVGLALGWALGSILSQLWSYKRKKSKDEKCAEKDHMSSQRRTRCIVITCVLIACVVIPVLSGIMLRVYGVNSMFLAAVGGWALGSSLVLLLGHKRKKNKDDNFQQLVFI